MKRYIYLFIAVLMCTFTACRKEVLDVREFAR